MTFQGSKNLRFSRTFPGFPGGEEPVKRRCSTDQYNAATCNVWMGPERYYSTYILFS
jgi:hypothetical protein